MLSLDRLKEILKKLKINPYVVPISLFAVGVIFLLFWASPQKKETSQNNNFLNTQEYVEMLEHTLKKNINKLDSVNDCSVMITIASIDDNEYLENKSISSMIKEDNEEYSREQEYLVIDDGGDDRVVIKSRRLPKISGALVIYEGSADIETKKNISDAVSTVLSIQSNKVCVLSNQE